MFNTLTQRLKTTTRLTKYVKNSISAKNQNIFNRISFFGSNAKYFGSAFDQMNNTTQNLDIE
jgi:hypothetical protein